MEPPRDRHSTRANDDPRIFSVSELTGAVRRSLESTYGRVRVRGEISGMRRPSSGHLYFSLKDDRSQLRAVMFRGDAAGLRFTPADGLEVEGEGEVTVYEPRGDLQLIVRGMAPSGVGALMQAFEALKRRLAAEGLFDPSRKRPLPRYPRVIGLVTSPTGAAIRDLVHVIARRWPPAEIEVYPTRVQGDGAAEEIAHALESMGRWGGADVIIVGRGGGSLEDLWAFNEEPVARAIASCPVPVVSAVGHEIDHTLADLAADQRAATPSVAAELVVPDRNEAASEIRGLDNRMRRSVMDGIESRRTELLRLANAYGFRRPDSFLEREKQRLDDLSIHLERAMRDLLVEGRDRCREVALRLAIHHPGGRLKAARAELDGRRDRLHQEMTARIRGNHDRLVGLDRALRALDPSRVLGRGYSMVRDPHSLAIVRSAGGLDAGAPLLIQFQNDRAHVRVDRVESGGPYQQVPVRKGRTDGQEEVTD